MRRLAAALAAALLLFSACEPYKDLKITSVKVESINPTSFRSVDAALKVEIYNPSYAFTLSELEGTIMIDGTPLAELSCPELSVKARSLEEYEVKGSGKLSQGAGISSIGSILVNPEKLTADVKGDLSGPFGIKRKFEYKGIPLKK